MTRLPGGGRAAALPLLVVVEIQASQLQDGMGAGESSPAGESAEDEPSPLTLVPDFYTYDFDQATNREVLNRVLLEETSASSSGHSVDVVTLHFPVQPTGTHFAHSWMQCIDVLRMRTTDFALIVDLSVCHCSLLKADDIERDAGSIARNGHLCCVALVVELDLMMWQVAEAAMLLRSPCKRTCLFADLGSARSWCEAQVTEIAGLAHEPYVLVYEFGVGNYVLQRFELEAEARKHADAYWCCWCLFLYADGELTLLASGGIGFPQTHDSICSHTCAELDARPGRSTKLARSQSERTLELMQGLLPAALQVQVLATQIDSGGVSPYERDEFDGLRR